MNIRNPFRTGLIATLGVLVAIVIGLAIGQLSTVLTYVGTAIFLALGIDPLVSWVERLRLPGRRKTLPRWAAILVVILVVLGALVGIMFAIIPAVVQQISELVGRIPSLVENIQNSDIIGTVKRQFPAIDVDAMIKAGQDWLTSNAGAISSGALQAGLGLLNGIVGTLIVTILTLYFVASLSSIKHFVYRLVPASKRERFAELTEQITTSVGRFVVGQAALGLANGVLTFIFLTIIGGSMPAVFAFVAFLGSLIPLVGTISAAGIIVVFQLLLQPAGSLVWLWAAIYYLVYMQVEAYIISPRIMSKAVSVPGAVVVIAALTGGTLLGILGALIAIPVAASIQLIIKEVIIPRQQEK